MSGSGEIERAGLQVVRPDGTHREKWNELYAAYADFYRVSQTQAMRDRVWHWIQDESHEVDCFVVLGGRRQPLGLAHFREFARPLAASTGAYLDDLFVEPAARGSGAAQALFAALTAEGHRRGWSVIRWITAEDNHRARALYDKVAARTPWLTYDLTP